LPGFCRLVFKETVEVDSAALVAKNLDAAQSAAVARKIFAVLSALPDVSHATVKSPMRELITDLGLSPNQVFGILRVAVTGQSVSPPLF